MSSADLPAAVPRTSCQTHTAPGPAGTTGHSISGAKGKARRSLLYCARATAALSALRQRPAPAPSQSSPYKACKSLQALANTIIFLNKFTFPVHFVSPQDKMHLTQLKRTFRALVTHLPYKKRRQFCEARVSRVNGCNKLPAPYHRPCLEGPCLSHTHTSSHFMFRGWHLHPAKEKNRVRLLPCSNTHSDLTPSTFLQSPPLVDTLPR